MTFRWCLPVLALLGCAPAPVPLLEGIPLATPEAVAMNAARLQPLLAQLRDPAGAYQEVHSLLVYHRGYLVLEEYFPGNDDRILFREGIVREARPPVQWHRERQHYVASVNKALSATLAGIAVQQGVLALEQPVMSLLPDYATRFDDPHKRRLTIEHLLTMQLGFVWDEWGDQDLVLLWQSDDFADFLLQRANTGPGAAWVYNSAGSNLLLRALAQALDEPLRDWAARHFYHPLGIVDYRWQAQPGGYPEGAARMHLRPLDMLKVGITYLHGGRWGGEQILPADWVEAVFRVQARSEHGDYSYGFWLRSLGGYRYLSAEGDGGQYINIFPELDLVIVITQGNYLEWPGYFHQAERLMQTLIDVLEQP